jgi:hypothetical protein
MNASDDAELARYFDDAVLAAGRGQWAAASELLAEVVRRAPT